MSGPYVSLFQRVSSLALTRHYGHCVYILVVRLFFFLLLLILQALLLMFIFSIMY